MDEEIERLIVSVRADTAGFRRDVDLMRGDLEGPLAEGAERAGRLIENSLVRAVRTGRVGFDDLKRVALATLAEIASAAIRNGIGAAAGGGGNGMASFGSLIGGLIGLPGRAIGGQVAPGRPYLVGERGPELFVPTSSGAIEPSRPAAARDIRLSISINAPAGAEPRALERSSRQVARAIRHALLRAE